MFIARKLQDATGHKPLTASYSFLGMNMYLVKLYRTVYYAMQFKEAAC